MDERTLTMLYWLAHATHMLEEIVAAQMLPVDYASTSQDRLRIRESVLAVKRLCEATAIELKVPLDLMR